ncbi:MAG: hypothetical protein NDI61_13340 [Bdellovibrionaceae bacterium]|nr:hypothetical protein [Pseudobdellovibrionaceae bacterium]
MDADQRLQTRNTRALRTLGYLYSIGVFITAMTLAAQYHLGFLQIPERAPTSSNPGATATALAAGKSDSPSDTKPDALTPEVVSDASPQDKNDRNTGPARSDREAPRANRLRPVSGS